MAGFRVGRKKSAEDVELNTWLEQAKVGDDKARDALLRAYSPFVLRVTSSAAKRYINKGTDDEFSVALVAMNEAIDRFEGDRNASFLHFAETVIRRRLIDYFRSQQASRRAVVWSEFDAVDDEDNALNFAEVESAVTAHARHVEQQDRVREIELYGEALSGFGLSFSELTEIAPKHADARENAMEVARIIAESEELRRYVFDKKSLPLKALKNLTTTSRKTLERQRKYILAIVILLCGEFDYLREYIS